MIDAEARKKLEIQADQVLGTLARLLHIGDFERFTLTLDTYAEAFRKELDSLKDD
jgi:ABC-type transporter Mla subunit MlaD